MASINLSNEINISTQNEIGSLTKITQALASQNINILALCAYITDGQAHFMLLTNDNQKSQAILKDSGYNIQLKEIITIELSNKVGTLKDITQKLAEASIDGEYCYGSAADGNYALLVLSTSNNKKALEALSS